jgi:hypothetical protein
MDTNLSKHMQQGMSQGRDTIKSGVGRMYDNPVESFNLNNAFLLMIARELENWGLIKQYGINGRKDCPDYYNQLIHICEICLDYLSAALSEEEERNHETDILKYYATVETLFMKGSDGSFLMDKQKSFNFMITLSRKFRMLLRLMDEKGLLRKKTIDPRLAMADMS